MKEVFAGLIFLFLMVFIIIPLIIGSIIGLILGVNGIYFYSTLIICCLLFWFIIGIYFYI